MDRDDAYVSVIAGVERVARDLLSGPDSLVDDWLTSRLLRRSVISAVQHHLGRLAYYHGPMDGVPGPQTESAIIQFQREHGLRVDAMIGPDFIVALEAKVRDQPPEA